jgi:hypothetical protein
MSAIALAAAVIFWSGPLLGSDRVNRGDRKRVSLWRPWKRSVRLKTIDGFQDIGDLTCPPDLRRDLASIFFAGKGI